MVKIKKILSFFKRPLGIVTGIVVLLVATGIYLNVSQSKAPAYETVKAVRKDVIEEVSVTGRVKPAESVDLAFERSGKVASVRVAVGDRVSTGQVLVTLESRDIAADLAQANATVQAEEARLAELMRGARPEQLQVQKQKVANAEIAVQDAKRAVMNQLNDAYTKSDDAVRVRTSAGFTGYKTSGYSLTYNSCNTAADVSAVSLRLQSELALDAWLAEIGAFSSENTSAALYAAIKNAKANMALFASLFQSINVTLTTGCALSDTSLSTYRTSIATGRTNLDAAISGLSTAEEKLRGAESALALSKQDLILTEAGTASEQVDAQKAQVARARAVVANYEAQLSKTIIRSPLSGVVTAKGVKVGEIVSPSTAAVSVISRASFETETNIPEADVSKVHMNDEASITLDAYGRDVIFPARVVSVEPAETIVDGVATYKTKLHFTKEDDRIKSGMTANIIIRGEHRENVVTVPQRAVIRKDGKKMVRVVVDGAAKEIEVETGLRGSTGEIEIVSGLGENDAVIVFGAE